MPRRCALIDPAGLLPRQVARQLSAHDVRDRRSARRLAVLYGDVRRARRMDDLDWALVQNHHHFVIQLTEGGLSEGMRELHGGYSRWMHMRLRANGHGPLVPTRVLRARARRPKRALLVAAAYVDLNPARASTWRQPGGLALVRLPSEDRPRASASVPSAVGPARVPSTPAGERAQLSTEQFVQERTRLRRPRPFAKRRVPPHG